MRISFHSSYAPGINYRTFSGSFGAAPSHQMRRVEAFLAQEGAELAGARERIRLPQNLELVPRCIS